MKDKIRRSQARMPSAAAVGRTACLWASLVENDHGPDSFLQDETGCNPSQSERPRRSQDRPDRGQSAEAGKPFPAPPANLPEPGEIPTIPRVWGNSDSRLC